MRVRADGKGYQLSGPGAVKFFKTESNLITPSKRGGYNYKVLEMIPKYSIQGLPITPLIATPATATKIITDLLEEAFKLGWIFDPQKNIFVPVGTVILRVGGTIGGSLTMRGMPVYGAATTGGNIIDYFDGELNGMGVFVGDIGYKSLI